MREILFRGKRTDNGEWVYGQLLLFKSSVGEKHFALIVESCEWDNNNEWFNLCKRAKVIPETVGQYTGLTDKNGKKIFEGDILKITDKYNNSVIWFVEYKNGGFMLRQQDVIFYTYFGDFSPKHYYCEIIGNIHNNPELIESGCDNDRIHK